MYKSDELEAFPEQIEKIFSALENDVMQNIIDRIKENDEITRTADWQAYRLYQMGKTTDAIRTEIQSALEMTEAEIENLYVNVLKEGYARDETLYTATGKRFIPYEENEQLQQLIKAVKEQTNDEILNITQTTGFAVRNVAGKKKFMPVKQYLQKVLDETSMHALNGTYDYNTVIRKTINEMTASGVRSIDYASGKSNRIDVAVRRAVVTGMNQVTAKIAEDNMQKLDAEFVETSWHSTARPSHQIWQGRVFYWDKSNPNAEKNVEGILYKAFVKETGYGEVDGLCGANCYHTFYPFIPGVSVRNYTDEELDKMNAEENEKKVYNGKEYTKYEATQYQRKLERVMRKQRQDIKLLKDSGLTDEDDEVIYAKCRYQGTSSKYSNFSKAMELEEHRERVTIDGLRNIGYSKTTKNAAHSTHSDEKVFYNENNDYSVKLDSQSEIVNKGLSEAAESVAKLGTSDGYEHMYLVNAKTGVLSFYETSEMIDEVGDKFWTYVDKHKNENFYFVHNHNVVSSLSLPDVNIPAKTENIIGIIGVQNNGVKYMAERTSFDSNYKNADTDDYFRKEMEELNSKVRNGIISMAERTTERERILTKSVLNSFFEKGEIIVDGRK